ncbi:MAG: RecQ family ATP-dependent DNA helicase [Tepidiformaceae bacterium]
MTAVLDPESRLLASARAVLRETFGYTEFRPGQRDVIASVLLGHDTLAVMPTGAGKSICYQLPALVNTEGLTLVVSPLLALMKDQVDALRDAGVAAAAINSSMSRDDQLATLREAGSGQIRLLYVAPERFDDGAFMSVLRGMRVALLAIDEAHCISQWGHDFRPSYRDLARVRPAIGNPPIVALTATADARVRADVIERLELRSPDVHVAGFDRPNLRFDVIRVRNQKDKLPIIAERIKALKDASAIVYCATRKKTEEVTDALQRAGVRCARYHAGMEDADRRRIQDAFARDSVRVIVATNAFGMGIDKPDIRLVFHHDLPDSMESYYQEAGRAGRDGEPAECILLYAPRDRSLREFFIDLAHPAPETVLDVYRALVRAGDRVHIREVMTSDEEPGINAAVQALVDSGLAGRRGQMVWPVRTDGEDSIDLKGLEAHRAHAVHKLDSIQSYAESATCLRTRILDYFGDVGHPPACGNCGPCVAPPAAAANVVPGVDSDLFESLRALRRQIASHADVPPYVIFADATLRAMAAARPRTEHEMLQVTGVGRVKWERYGEAFLALTRASAPAEQAVRTPAAASARPQGTRARDGSELGATVRRTLELYREGKALEEIVAQRGLNASTIAAHLAQLVTAGEIDDISPWVDAPLLARIRRAANGEAVGALAPLRESLGEAVSYEQLHLARAYINRSLAAAAT